MKNKLKAIYRGHAIEQYNGEVVTVERKLLETPDGYTLWEVKFYSGKKLEVLEDELEFI